MPQTTSLSYVEFKELQTKKFTPISQMIIDFAQQNGLNVEQLFDLDPISPQSCYFCTWSLDEGSKRFIRICSQNVFSPVSDFYIDAEEKKIHRRWTYSIDEGNNRLKEILDTAKNLLDALGMRPFE